MQMIVCYIDLFDYEQKIYLIEDNKQELIFKTPIENIGTKIASICYEKGIYNVHLVGEQNYISDIMDTIYTVELFYYKDNKIKIEVN